MIPAGHPRPSPDSAALNLSTFVALYTYGYRNAWESGPLVDVTATSLPLEGAAAPGS